MNRLVSFLVCALATAGCFAPSTVYPGAAADQLDSASTLGVGRIRSFVNALQDAAPAGRAATMTAVIAEAAGVISNNGAGLVGERGNGVISGGGAGLIGRRKWHLAGVLDKVPFTVETEDLVYYIHGTTDTEGEFKTYTRDAYKAATDDAAREKALVDHFTWADLQVELDDKAQPPRVNTTFHITRVTSKRSPFAEHIVAKMITSLLPADAGLQTRAAGWDITFDIPTALADATEDVAHFRAVAGEKDIQAFTTPDGATFSIPTNLALTGSNARGAYSGHIDNGAKAIAIQMVHDAKDGSHTEIEQTMRRDGSLHYGVKSQASRLVLEVDRMAEAAATGKIKALAGADLGTIAIDPSGLGDISFTDGSHAKARVF